jgi:uncharacterized membrane-anchored protein YhcB (DUF1043 family)
MQVTIKAEDLLGAIIDRFVQPILTRQELMSAEIQALQATLDAHIAQVTSTTQHEAVLKAALDAALAALGNLNAQVAALNTQLAEALANAKDPADVAAINAITATVQAATQTLADSQASTAPTN